MLIETRIAAKLSNVLGLLESARREQDRRIRDDMDLQVAFEMLDHADIAEFLTEMRKQGLCTRHGL